MGLLDPGNERWLNDVKPKEGIEKREEKGKNSEEQGTHGRHARAGTVVRCGQNGRKGMNSEEQGTHGRHARAGLSLIHI